MHSSVTQINDNAMTPLLVLSTVLALVWITNAAANNDNEPWFELSSGNKAYDTAYQLALTEMAQNIENGTFIAGAGWKQLWTRDTSYAVESAAGLVHPLLSKTSLQKSIETDPVTGQQVWLQDECDHFGGWPNLSDAIVGVRGSWALYFITGDLDFLSWTYQITLHSLARAERDVYQDSTGLFTGCSSFMESDSGYPAKYSMNGTLVGMTKALSTNMLHYEGYKLSAKMAKLLEKDNDEIQALETKAEQLRERIRSRLWSHEHGYYSYFEDENEALLPQMEGLGEALALLGTDFEHDAGRVQSIFDNTYRTERGIPSLWPRFVYPKDSMCESDSIECYYHNGRIWPFVTGYFGLAAARHGQVQTFVHELDNLVWLSQQKNTFAEFYETDGTFPKKRSRQLWSDTGFLNLVYHGLFGLTFSPQGVEFRPVKPPSIFAETISLRGVHYRNMILDIYVSGSGSNIASVKLDGHRLHMAYVPGNVKGRHSIVIVLGDNVSGAEEKEVDTDISFKPHHKVLATLTIVLSVVWIRRKAYLRRRCPLIGGSDSERLTQ